MVGCFPPYSPEELVHASGMIPMGLWGGRTELALAKSYLPAFACPIMQADMEFGLKGAYQGLSAVIIPAACDTLRCMEMEEKTASKRRKTLERELEWVRMAPKARQAKGKARLNSYDKLLNEDLKEKEEKLEIFIPNGPRLGNKVIEAKHVAKAYGDKLLFDDLNFMLPPNGIVG